MTKKQLKIVCESPISLWKNMIYWGFLYKIVKKYPKT